MEISTPQMPVERSARFRSPNPHERACGLWVDRIGWKREDRAWAAGLRILGLYAFVAIEEGAGELLSSRSGRFAVRAGDVIVVPPHEAMTYQPAGAGWCQRWVVWGGPAAATLAAVAGLEGLGPVVHDATEAVARAYVRLRDRMAGEALEDALEREAVVRSLVAQVLGASRRGGLTEAQSSALDRVLALIRRDACKALTLPLLARCAGVSETHLRRLFLARMGVAPHAYITVQRLARAKSLLAEGVPTREVAEACGFDDVAYFRRVFKQVTGITPGRWRTGA